MQIGRCLVYRWSGRIGLSLIAFLILGALAPVSIAQDLRYELGGRLRMFEMEFEYFRTPEARALPLEHLNNSVQNFFGLKMLNALQELDAARIAISSEQTQPILKRVINMRLNMNARLLDPLSQTLVCTIDPLYGERDWSHLVLDWQVDRIRSRRDQTKYCSDADMRVLAGKNPLSVESDVTFSIPIESLDDGDYMLHLFIFQSKNEGDEVVENVPGVYVGQQVFSVAREARQRVERLASEIERLATDLETTQVASLKNNVTIVQRILESERLETDFLGARILRQSEESLQRLLAGKNAYGNRQPGEFWLATATSSGQKWMRLMAPEAAAQGQPLPLVIALHGAGGSENMFFDAYGDGKIVQLAEHRHWLLVAPRVTLGGLKFDDLVDTIDKLYPVDRQAIFIVGHSMGAGVAVAMTGAASHRPTAVAALGGGRAIGDAKPFRDVPVFVAAGSHDFGRTGARQLADSLQRGGVTVEYRDYENVEHLAIVQVALDDVFQFFDQHYEKLLNAQSRFSPSELRIDQLQLVGTHNSYHLAPDEVAMRTIISVVPREAESIDNSQRTLTEQFERLRVRHVELDLFRDPDGNLFSKPFAYVQAQKQQADVPPFDPEQKMSKPGIKVLHSPDFDYRTTVYTFVDALQEIKNWSDENRQHVPIFILTELKSESFSPMTRPLKWTVEAFQELESEILSVFPRERILTPDDVRGTADTLREAVQGRGWPTVDSQRGKVAFLLDNEGSLAQLYLTRSPILEGCLLFVSVSRDHPAAAWFKRNDPIRSFDEIVELVGSGFLVRTRADVGTVQSRRNDPTQREKAIASGAQLISTDYPEPDLRFSNYCVTLPLPD